MPSLTIENLKEIIKISFEKQDDYKTFIETGTNRGHTIIPMSSQFDFLYTIELSESIFNEFNGKDYNREKIKSILGDSSKVLPNILPEINTNAIFFLDGHYSHEDTAQGEKDVPLLEEINAINDFFKNSGIIIIDDLRLFGTTNDEDWSEINTDSVKRPIEKRITSTFTIGDRFVICFKK